MRLTSTDALAAAGRKLRDAAGIPPDGQAMTSATLANSQSLIGEIYRAAKSFDTANVPRTQSATPAPFYHGRWNVRASSQDTLDFSPDYFQALLDSGVVKKEDAVPAGFYNPGWNNYHIRVIAEGPWKNQLLVSDRVTLDRIPYFYPASTGADPLNKTFDPGTIQAASKDVAIAHVYRPTVLQRLPAAVTAKLAQIKADDFEYWGEVFRLLGTLVRWRAAARENISNALLANVVGPYSLAELSAIFPSKFKAKLSWAGDWSVEAAQITDACIVDAIELLRTESASLPNNKGAPVIDDNLRRLAGFMTTRGIAIPETC